MTPVTNSSALDEQEVQPGKGWGPGKIAIVEVEGTLINARNGGAGLLGFNLGSSENPMSKFVQQMEAAERDSAVKAVVLRINSPGGTVTSSDTMYEIVRRFKEKTGKPVVASTQEVAASGGYYVACAADWIVAQPTSVVGSIGVIFEAVNFKGTADKLGVSVERRQERVPQGHGLAVEGAARTTRRQVMQEMVDEYFARFVDAGPQAGGR